MPDPNAAVNVFDNNAEAYDTYRPKCPVEVVEALRQRSQIQADHKILEIGCGTGQLTVALAAWKCPIIALEKGTNLASLAKKNCAAYPQIEIEVGDFESWESPHKFKLVTACQSFHWIDGASGLKRVYDLLEAEGKIALIWHLDVSQKTLFWQKTAPIYQAFFPANKATARPSNQVDRYTSYLSKSPLFSSLIRQDFDWEVTYSKADYLGLLSTFSTQSQLLPAKQKQFSERIGEVIDAFAGQVTRKHRTVMLLAQKQ